MNKQELIAATSEKSGYETSVVRSVLDAAGLVVLQAVSCHDEVSVIGLGKMRVVHRPARKARDIRRGTDVVVPARYAPVFRPSSTVVRSINAKPGKRGRAIVWPPQSAGPASKKAKAKG